jgi:cytidylate kinase
MNQISVAIDGPSGAGKSTLALQAAQRLGFLYVDTGAIYRTVALACQRRNISPEHPEQVEALLPQLKLDLDYGENGEQRMLLDGEDVSALIRTPEISMLTSAVSAIPQVRTYLLEMQRRLAQTRNVVMDGRDIGTVVLPQATVKIYLTAAPEARAQRRCTQLREKGMDVSFADVLRDVQERDDHDTHRAVSPLRRAEDARVLDTTCLDLAESLEVLVSMIREGIPCDEQAEG